MDILQDTFMVRQLQPWAGNIKKRLVKSPKVYLRDSGLLHALFGLGTQDEILGHPVAGSSWEGWVMNWELDQLGGSSQYPIIKNLHLLPHQSHDDHV